MKFFSWEHFFSALPRLLGQVHITIGITLCAFFFGLLWGLCLAAARLYRVPVLSQLASLYISFIRGTPVLIQLLICNIALPSVIWSLSGVNVGRLWPPISFVIIAYSLNVAAFLAETIRASISGVDGGQQEAALSVGLTEFQSLCRVVLPQAFRIALPSLANSLSGLLKDTSLAFSAAGILDVMGMVSAIAGLTYRNLEGYVGAALIFFALCLLIERGFHFLSASLSRGVAAPGRA
jgi:L-cystine transport system permease protein